MKDGRFCVHGLLVALRKGTCCAQQNKLCDLLARSEQRPIATLHLIKSKLISYLVILARLFPREKQGWSLVLVQLMWTATPVRRSGLHLTPDAHLQAI